MAYTTIDDPTQYFNTVLYTGNGSDDRSISGVGFQPDWVWIKERSATSGHILSDSVRGATKFIQSHNATAEDTNADIMQAFESDGFQIGTHQAVNENTETYVSWNWKKTATAGFDIVSYTGNDTARTISHSLSAVPNMIIIKDRDAGNDWFVYHSGNTSAPETDYIKLNSTNATADLNSLWNDTAPTSSVFTIGTNGNINTTGNDYIAYCFANVQGYCQVGSYKGNGDNADGACVYTGFKPAWVMIKRTDSTSQWCIIDNKRPGYNIAVNTLFANLSAVEATDLGLNFFANGFKEDTTNNLGADGGDYIYLAFAESPFVNSKGVPNNAE